MTASTFSPASTASTISSWPGRKALKPKTECSRADALARESNMSSHSSAERRPPGKFLLELVNSLPRQRKSLPTISCIYYIFSIAWPLHCACVLYVAMRLHSARFDSRWVRRGPRTCHRHDPGVRAVLPMGEFNWRGVDECVSGPLS